MDEEMRLKRLEFRVDNHNRRLDDHDAIHAKDVIWKADAIEQISMMRKIFEETQKQTAIFVNVAEDITSVRNYAQKTYDVVHPLSKILFAAGKIGAAGVVLWHGGAIAYGALKAAVVKLVVVFS